jgi:hypothetical protein
MSTKAIIGFAFALTAVVASPAFAQAKSRTGSGPYDRQARANVHELASPHTLHRRRGVYNHMAAIAVPIRIRSFAASWGGVTSANSSVGVTRLR